MDSRPMRPAWCAAYAARINPAPTRETNWIRKHSSTEAAARPGGRRVSGRGRQAALDPGLPLELAHIDADLVLALAGREAGPDLLMDLVERDRPRRPLLRDLDDVEAAARFDHVAGLSGLQREGDPLDGRGALALDEQPRITPLGGLGALRVPAGENREIAAGADLLEDRLDFLASLGAGLQGGIRRDTHDDLPQMDRLAAHHL